MVECPTCGGSFESDRSMRHHHSMVHDKPLPNNTCEDCGVKFFSEHSTNRKYCDKCSSFEGDKNPNYSDKKVTTSCSICGSQFDYYPSEKPGEYCSVCVEEENWREVPEPAYGEKNPQYNSVNVECSNCGSDIEIPESQLTEKNYCGMRCYAEHRSEFQQGEQNPNYKDGEYRRSDFYQGDWQRVKQECLERDDSTCQKCGESEGIIDVHHIRPVRKFEEPNDAHTLENVVCLCRSCHISIDHGDDDLPKDLSISGE